mgnify:CR=1 FL=1
MSSLCFCFCLDVYIFEAREKRKENEVKLSGRAANCFFCHTLSHKHNSVSITLYLRIAEFLLLPVLFQVFLIILVCCFQCCVACPLCVPLSSSVFSETSYWKGYTHSFSQVLFLSFLSQLCDESVRRLVFFHLHKLA